MHDEKIGTINAIPLRSEISLQHPNKCKRSGLGMTAAAAVKHVYTHTQLRAQTESTPEHVRLHIRNNDKRSHQNTVCRQLVLSVIV